jgi:hypothetical protein
MVFRERYCIVSLIDRSLYRLDMSVRKLEGSMRVVERAFAGQQRDMFSVPEPANNDGALIAKRLDSAIEKVEALLKEGRG